VKWYLRTSQKISLQNETTYQEDMCQLAFLETTIVTPRPKEVPIKGAKERARSTPTDTLTCRDPSLWEHVNSQFLNSKMSQTKPSFPKRKVSHIVKPSSYLILRPTTVPNPNLPHIDHMPLFMKPYIKTIESVKGNDNSGF